MDFGFCVWSVDRLSNLMEGELLFFRPNCDAFVLNIENYCVVIFQKSMSEVRQGI